MFHFREPRERIQPYNLSVLNRLRRSNDRIPMEVAWGARSLAIRTDSMVFGAPN